MCKYSIEFKLGVFSIILIEGDFWVISKYFIINHKLLKG